MPITKVDNRLRITPELWTSFLDKCANKGLPYRAVIEALITLFCLDMIDPFNPTRSREIIVPQEIPKGTPVNDSLIQSLLDGDLFE